LVLEKPAKFNPPSHGARLPKKDGMPKHYGGELSSAQVKAQARREYPGMKPAEGTWADWFLNYRMIHVFITLVSALFACLSRSQTDDSEP
jgi:hypothetical protein